MTQSLPTDAERKSEHLWVYATVTAVDCTRRPPAIKARLDDKQSTDWIPFSSLRAGKAYIWMPPSVGEQGIVLSAGGEMESMLFISGVFTDQYLPDNPRPELTEIKFPNGDIFRHSSETGDLAIMTLGKFTVDCGDEFRVKSNSDAVINAKNIYLN